jgi:hypothetical protein
VVSRSAAGRRSSPWPRPGWRRTTRPRKAQSFLAKTQREDGSWAVVSRAIMRNGKPYKKLEPITHAGSAWAVLGLVRSSPKVAKTGGTGAQEWQRTPGRGWH